ncbi:hypothetical protein [Methylobacterium sp. CM6257]
MAKPTEAIVDAIDGLAEIVTVDRQRFYERDATTPRPDLPPVKWRTVEWTHPCPTADPPSFSCAAGNATPCRPAAATRAVCAGRPTR